MSRAEARAAGAGRYENGRPCVHGHLAPRLTSTAACVTCARIAEARRRERQATIPQPSTRSAPPALVLGRGWHVHIRGGA